MYRSHPRRTPLTHVLAARTPRVLWLTAALLAAAAILVVTPLAAATSALGLLPGAWTDDRGQAFDLHALTGRTVVLTMAYANCHRVCPTTMAHLQQLQQDFDRRGTSAEFLVIGYDPDSDDAATWHQYRRTRHLNRDNWHFLVGTRAAVEQTARQLGFDYWKYDQHVIHDSRIVYFDARGALVKSDRQTQTGEYIEVGQ